MMQTMSAFNEIMNQEISGKMVDDIMFSTLTKNSLFVELRAQIVTADQTIDVRVADPYMEFTNCPSGREALLDSGLPKNYIDAALLVWGDEPTLPDPPESGIERPDSGVDGPEGEIDGPGETPDNPPEGGEENYVDPNKK